MVLTHIAIGLTLYALARAVASVTSTYEEWRLSTIYSAAKLFTNADEEALPFTYWGPHQMNSSRKPVLGIFPQLANVYSTATFLQLPALIYPIYMALSANYGWFLGLISAATGYGLYILVKHVIETYVIMKDKNKYLRIAMVVVTTIAFVLSVTNLNKYAKDRLISVNAAKIEEYRNVVNNLEQENGRLLQDIEASKQRQQTLVQKVDSLSSIRMANQKQYQDAIEFLKEFIEE